MSEEASEGVGRVKLHKQPPSGLVSKSGEVETKKTKGDDPEELTKEDFEKAADNAEVTTRANLAWHAAQVNIEKPMYTPRMHDIRMRMRARAKVLLAPSDLEQVEGRWLLHWSLYVDRGR